jgi:hypothetical protein
MGQFGQQCGVTETDLKDKNFLTQVQAPELYLFQQEAVEINDDYNTCPETKERLLTELLAKHGHTLIIEGEYK